MEVPRNLDFALKQLLADAKLKGARDASGTRRYLSDEDISFLHSMLDSIEEGSRGVFIVLHPDDRMQYMLINTNRAGSLGLLGKVIQRASENIEGSPS